MRVAVTLIELLLVTALLVAVAGVGLAALGSTAEHADAELARSRCAAVAEAARRFALDMGEPPRLVAELLQSPDPSAAEGGWWWRGDGTPATRLRRYDSATRRGWAGPYLVADPGLAALAEAAEARLSATAPAAWMRVESDRAAGRRLMVQSCPFAGRGQARAADGRLLSHLQLDASRADDLRVRLVDDPAKADPAELASVATGLRP